MTQTGGPEGRIRTHVCPFLGGAGEGGGERRGEGGRTVDLLGRVGLCVCVEGKEGRGIKRRPSGKGRGGPSAEPKTFSMGPRTWSMKQMYTFIFMLCISM